MRFDPHDKVHIERLRLVLNGMAQSFPVGFALATLLVFTLYDEHTHAAMLTWYALFAVSRIGVVWYSRRFRHAPLPPPRARRIVRWMLAAKMFEGMLWGSLVWIALDSAPLPGKVLVISVMAAIAGNAVSLLSPVLGLYLALALSMLAMMASKMLAMDDVIYTVFAVCCGLYIIGQFGQARLAARNIHESIALRFENVDLIERLRVESDLARRAKAEAERANIAKSKFLAAASHDLRQPIHALGLFLEALSTSRLTPQQQTMVTNAQQASLASSEMLNTLLDFSRIDAGVISPKPRRVALQAIFHNLETELAPLANAKGLVYRVRETPLALHTDPTLFELILRNLVANAIRYTPRGGLLVACRRRGGRLLVSVHDTGIGIAEDQRGEIFTEFHQLGNPERDRRKGLGLGLAIADGLAKSLGYAIEVTSRPGRGSVFQIAIPWQAVAPASTAPVADDADADADVAAPQPVPATFPGLSVLVIDDDESVLLGMEHLLTSWGCRCLPADSLERALAWCRAQTPDAIVCDYRLREEQHGVQVLACLRDTMGHLPPAVLITGDTAPERLREATASGIPLLHKPIRPASLKAFLAGATEAGTGAADVAGAGEGLHHAGATAAAGILQTD